jgi:CubicO group peptidase (beta-lactamase class C family)
MIFLHKSWGKLTPEPDSLPVQEDSLFGMASCSKPVTAAALMVLQEQGLLDLHEPLNQYIPEFEGPGSEKITIHHLLTHTSGLPIITDSETTTFPENGLCFQPGTEVLYSSLGYNLLGELVERVSSDSFEKFAQERIFKPLGMHNTTFVHVGMDPERCVLRRPGTTYDWPEDMEGTVSPSSSLWSTAYDMGVFLQTFSNKGWYGKYQLLSAEGVDAMTRDQTSGLPREIAQGVQIPPVGFGWFILGGSQFPNYPRSFSAASYGHSGASGAFIWVDPKFDLIGAFLFTKIQEDFRPLDLFVDTLVDCITGD